MPPGADGTGWRIVEIESDLESDDGQTFDSSAGALHAAFDTLTIMVEGRMPAMHEHAQESVRDLVRSLEARGYDREAAVKLLLDMVDRRRHAPPKAARPRSA